MIHLNNENVDGIIVACMSYSKRADAVRFSSLRVQQKQIASLLYWVKDRYCIDKAYLFNAGINEPTFLTLMQDAYGF